MLSCWYNIKVREQHPDIDTYLMQIESRPAWKTTALDQSSQLQWILDQSKGDPESKLSTKSIDMMKKSAIALKTAKQAKNFCL